MIILAKDSGRVGRLAFYGSPDEAKEFFGRDSMEDIVQCVNRSEEGGEGLADEYIEKYARSRIDSSGTGKNTPQGPETAEKPAEHSPEEAEEKSSDDQAEEAEEDVSADDQMREEVSSDEE